MFSEFKLEKVGMALSTGVNKPSIRFIGNLEGFFFNFYFLIFKEREKHQIVVPLIHAFIG